MRGRPPKPTAIKELEGNPWKRPLNDAEPKYESRVLQVPKHLDDEARKEWHRVIKELASVGLIAKVDRAALAAYCVAWSRWVKAEKELEYEDLVLTTEKGYSYPNPLLGIANTALATMRTLMVEVGMTPSSRTKVKAEKPDEPDELTQILFGEKVKVNK